MVESSENMAQPPEKWDAGDDLRDEDLPDGHSELTEGLPPVLLQVSSKLYPGSWAPPAIMLTYGSILVFLSTLSFVLRSRLTQNLFRFPVPEGWRPPFD